MEKVRPQCGQPSDRGRLKIRSDWWFVEQLTNEVLNQSVRIALFRVKLTVSYNNCNSNVIKLFSSNLTSWYSGQLHRCRFCVKPLVTKIGLLVNPSRYVTNCSHKSTWSSLFAEIQMTLMVAKPIIFCDAGARTFVQRIVPLQGLMCHVHVLNRHILKIS